MIGDAEDSSDAAGTISSKMIGDAEDSSDAIGTTTSSKMIGDAENSSDAAGDISFEVVGVGVVVVSSERVMEEIYVVAVVVVMVIVVVVFKVVVVVDAELLAADLFEESFLKYPVIEDMVVGNQMDHCTSRISNGKTQNKYTSTRAFTLAGETN